MTLNEKLLQAKTSHTLFSDLTDTDRKKNYLFARVAVLLQRCRREKNIGQSELAKQLGVSQPSISKLESGDANISMGRLVETFDALGYDLDIEVTPKKQSYARVKIDSINAGISMSKIIPLNVVDWKAEWNEVKSN